MISLILLQFKDGRKISIIQNKKSAKHGIGAYGKYGETCEVWVDGDEDPVCHLTAEELIQFLQEKK